MKKICILSSLVVALCAGFSTGAFAVVYEASSLHDAVGRSETVQDLFFERWSTIIDRQLYFDMYGKINWIPNFSVNTVDRATGEKKAVDMRLVRTYGSLTVNYPILGGYEGTDFSSRLAAGSSVPAETKESETESGLWKPKNLVLGLTMTGFHYGLTRATDVDRGDAGNETVTDYKFTQFFDDLFAASLVYQPYVYVHAGVIMNNQIDPKDDGTMDYSDGNEGFPTFRYFFASNLLSFLNANATTTTSKVEKISTGIEVNKLVALLTPIPKAVPVLTLTYKRLCMYNDEGFEAVWVGSLKDSNGNLKNDYMDDGLKQHANLHTLSVLVTENLGNFILADFFTEFQYCPKDLYEKSTSEKLTLRKTREIRGSLGINFLGLSGKRTDTLIARFGVGNYWDPGIAVHSDKGKGKDKTGFIASLGYDSPLFGAEFMFDYNYSKELRKLIESTDKFAIEGSFFFRI